MVQEKNDKRNMNLEIYFQQVASYRRYMVFLSCTDWSLPSKLPVFSTSEYIMEVHIVHSELVSHFNSRSGLNPIVSVG